MHQRHQHDGGDQDQRRRRVEIGLGAPRSRSAATGAALATACGLRQVTIRRTIRHQSDVAARRGPDPAVPEAAQPWRLRSPAMRYFLARNFCCALVR